MLNKSNAARLSIVGLGLILTMSYGCGSKPGSPTSSPSTSTATPTSSASVSGSPVAATTPDPAATAFVTRTPKSDDEKEYDSAKTKAKDLAFAKAYQEAVPLLRDCVKKRPDDWETQFILLLAVGSLEEEPTTKSEAYTIAKTILEKAPDSQFADRARDYVLSAESEPAEAKPDKDAEPLEGGETPFQPPDVHTAYTLMTPVTVFLSRTDALTPEVKKSLWYLEVKPEGVSADAKMTVPKGTSISVQLFKSYIFSKNSWRGGGSRSEREGEVNVDKNSFNIQAFRITLEGGPNKGTRGWYVNQMDRYKGLDEDGNRVWGVKVGPRLVVEAVSGPKK